MKNEIFNENSFCVKNEYTYRDLTKPVNRDRMQMIGVCTLGTQSGGFGYFNGQFKVVSASGLEQLAKEVGVIFQGNNELLKDAMANAPLMLELLSPLVKDVK